MILWLGKDTPNTEGHFLCASTLDELKTFIAMSEASMSGYANIEYIVVPDDSGAYQELAEWMNETGRRYPVRIFTRGDDF